MSTNKVFYMLIKKVNENIFRHFSTKINIVLLALTFMFSLH